MSESILEEAQRLIHGQRNKDYGHPRENFKNIADLWSAYLGKEIKPLDVPLMMILMKVARLETGLYHRDSVTDIAGYAGTVERLQEPAKDEHLSCPAEAPELPPRPEDLDLVPWEVEHVTDEHGNIWSRSSLGWTCSWVSPESGHPYVSYYRWSTGDGAPSPQEPAEESSSDWPPEPRSWDSYSHVPIGAVVRDRYGYVYTKECQEDRLPRCDGPFTEIIDEEDSM